MSALDALRRWLPIPEYRFVGGPVDGQIMAVTLIKTERGMMAPEIWNIGVWQNELPAFEPGTVSVDTVQTIHRYRFVPDGRFPLNAGHYEYMPNA